LSVASKPPNSPQSAFDALAPDGYVEMQTQIVKGTIRVQKFRLIAKFGKLTLEI
jgi:hypothetical protein